MSEEELSPLPVSDADKIDQYWPLVGAHRRACRAIDSLRSQLQASEGRVREYESKCEQHGLLGRDCYICLPATPAKEPVEKVKECGLCQGLGVVVDDEDFEWPCPNTPAPRQGGD